MAQSGRNGIYIFFPIQRFAFCYKKKSRSARIPFICVFFVVVHSTSRYTVAKRNDGKGCRIVMFEVSSSLFQNGGSVGIIRKFA